MYIGGAYIAFHARRSNLKKEVRNYLLTHKNMGGELLTFQTKNGIVSDESFAWEEEHEFSFNGKMYDVISVQHENNSVKIHCIKDDDENALMELYALSHKATGKNTSSSNQTLKFLTQLYCCDIPNDCSNSVKQKILHTEYYNAYFSSGFVNSLKEPPKG